MNNPNQIIVHYDAWSHILNAAGEQKTQSEKIDFLRRYANKPGIKKLLRYAVDPNIKWLLPEGNPPYTPSKFEEPGILMSEIRRLYIFTEGGNNSLAQSRREALFVELLGNVHPDDAKLLLLIKDKKLPKGLTAAVVKKAFPDIMEV